MSKRGKLLKQIKSIIDDAVPLSKKIMEVAPGIKALSDEDAQWIVNKMKAYPNFKLLPEDLTAEFDRDLLRNKAEDDDLPF